MSKMRFSEYVRSVIDVSEDEKRPFCPFKGYCGYCNQAYSNKCLCCEEAVRAYNKEFFNDKEKRAQ